MVEGSYGSVEESSAALLRRGFPRTRDRGGLIGAWPAVYRLIVESNPDVRLINGVPLVLIVGVVVTAIVVDLLGGVILDFDVNIVYRRVFRRLDQMVAEMEELRS